MHKKFVINRTKIKGGCQSRRKVVTHNSKTYFFFRQIEMTEYVDKLFDLETPYGQPNLSKFGELVNDEMWWVVTEIVSEPTVSKRVKIMKQFIKVLKGDVHFYFSFQRWLCTLKPS